MTITKKTKKEILTAAKYCREENGIFCFGVKKGEEVITLSREASETLADIIETFDRMAQYIGGNHE